jgi:hypothetical protein
MDISPSFTALAALSKSSMPYFFSSKEKRKKYNVQYVYQNSAFRGLITFAPRKRDCPGSKTNLPVTKTAKICLCFNIPILYASQTAHLNKKYSTSRACRLPFGSPQSSVLTPHSEIIFFFETEHSVLQLVQILTTEYEYNNYSFF